MSLPVLHRPSPNPLGAREPGVSGSMVSRQIGADPSQIAADASAASQRLLNHAETIATDRVRRAPVDGIPSIIRPGRFQPTGAALRHALDRRTVHDA